MRRAALILAIGAFSWSALPATAQAPAAAQMYGVTDESVVSGTLSITGKGSATTGVKRIAILLGNLTLAAEEPSGLQQEVTVRTEWDTTHKVRSSEIASNGAYTITVKVTAQGGATDKKSATVLVNNSPAAPTGVTATSGGGSVSLSWAPNPEPDIIAYRIERAAGDTFVAAGETSGTSFTESRKPGNYSYRVIAVRSTPIEEGSIASAPSESASATIKPQLAPAGSHKARSTRGGGNGSPRSRALAVGRRVYSRAGLPSGLSVGAAGLPDLPVSSRELPWGTYEEELPFDMPGSGVTLETGPATESAAHASSRLIPTSGMVWVVIGALFILASGALRLAAVRLAPIDRGPLLPAVLWMAGQIYLRIRRINRDAAS